MKSSNCTLFVAAALAGVSAPSLADTDEHVLQATTATALVPEKTELTQTAATKCRWVVQFGGRYVYRCIPTGNVTPRKPPGSNGPNNP